ncbi:hypothetical protein ACFFRH_27090 [Streptosporangium vulgare]|uniref:Uncharacterized protein n=1 Tax=Streptosporangium vulgare TaxID=46190 RepID=A0ABV5TJ74_9ACTN
MSTASSEKKPLGRPSLRMVSLGWLVLVALEYLWIPVFRVSELFAWLAITAAWLWATSLSVMVATTCLSLRDYGRCVAALLLALGAGAVVRTADWEVLYAEGLSGRTGTRSPNSPPTTNTTGRSPCPGG